VKLSVKVALLTCKMV